MFDLKQYIAFPVHCESKLQNGQIFFSVDVDFSFFHSLFYTLQSFCNHNLKQLNNL